MVGGIRVCLVVNVGISFIQPSQDEKSAIFLDDITLRSSLFSFLSCLFKKHQFSLWLGLSENSIKHENLIGSKEML